MIQVTLNLISLFLLISIWSITRAHFLMWRNEQEGNLFEDIEEWLENGAACSHQEYEQITCTMQDTTCECYQCVNCKEIMHIFREQG